MKIYAFEEETKKPAEVITFGERPTLVRIPGHYLHDTKIISSEPSPTVYFVTRLYNYKNPDEERRPWNDTNHSPGDKW